MRFLALEHGVKQPVFLAVKASYLVFAVSSDHCALQRTALCLPTGPRRIFSKQRRELVADEAVEQSARLLYVDKIVVDIHGLIDAVGDYLFGYLIKRLHALLFHRKAQEAPSGAMILLRPRGPGRLQDRLFLRFAELL